MRVVGLFKLNCTIKTSAPKQMAQLAIAIKFISMLDKFKIIKPEANNVDAVSWVKLRPHWPWIPATWGKKKKKDR